VLSRALDGPKSRTHDSAVIRGGIINGIRKQKTRARKSTLDFTHDAMCAI